MQNQQLCVNVREKMARKKKAIGVRQNKSSIQVYVDGDYYGSLSKKELCVLINKKKQSTQDT